MLHKPLISFIAAFAVATSVTASATPVVRGGGYGDSKCNTGQVQCCNQATNSKDPAYTSLLGIAPSEGASIPIWADCYNFISTSSCTSQPLCCENVSQDGLVNVGCAPVNINL